MSGKHPTPRGKAATDAKNRYNKAHYSNIHLAMKPEEKERIQAAASNAGTSVSEYVRDAIAAQMERDAVK